MLRVSCLVTSLLEGLQWLSVTLGLVLDSETGSQASVQVTQNPWSSWLPFQTAEISGVCHGAKLLSLTLVIEKKRFCMTWDSPPELASISSAASCFFHTFLLYALITETSFVSFLFVCF